jgi:hypothetical protein
VDRRRGAFNFLEAFLAVEHRNSPRRPVTLYTMLNYPSLGLVRGCIRDIGMSGMFVDIGRIQLPVNATLEISLMFGPSSLKAPMQVEAIVVRCAEKGVGLMFDELDSEMRYALSHIVFGASNVHDSNDCTDILH